MLTYTTTPPTKPGDYRWRPHASDRNYQLVGVYECAGELYVGNGPLSYHLAKSIGGEWCGPLVAAEEVERSFVEGYNSQFSSADSTADGQFARSRARRVAEGEEV